MAGPAQLETDVSFLTSQEGWKNPEGRRDFIRDVAVKSIQAGDMDPAYHAQVIGELWKRADDRGLIQKGLDFTGQAATEIAYSMPSLGGAIALAGSDALGLTDSGSANRLERGVYDLVDAGAQRVKSLHPDDMQEQRDRAIDALKTDLDNRAYPDGLEAWVAGAFDGGEHKPDEQTQQYIDAITWKLGRKAVAADHSGAVDQEKLRAWLESDRNPSRSRDDLGQPGPRALLGDYLVTRDPATWEAFAARVKETDSQRTTRLQRYANEGQLREVQQVTSPGLVSNLTQRSADFQTSPIDIVTSAIPFLKGAKAFTAARAGSRGAAALEATKGVLMEAGSEGLTEALQDPNASNARVLEAAALGATGAGVVTGAGLTLGATTRAVTDALARRAGQTTGNVISPSVPGNEATAAGSYPQADLGAGSSPATGAMDAAGVLTRIAADAGRSTGGAAAVKPSKHREAQAIGLPVMAANFPAGHAGLVVTEALQRIGQDPAFPANDPVRVVASALARADMRRLALEVVDDASATMPGMGGKASPFAGAYDPATGKITLNLAQKGRGEVGVSGTLVHEALHHVVDARLANPATLVEREAAAGLASIMDQTRQHSATQGDGTRFAYEFTTVDEFVAAAMTRPDLQQRMREMPAPPRSGFRHVWDQFVHWISRMIGKQLPQRTLLDEAVDQVLSLVRSAPQDVAPGRGTKFLPPAEGSDKLPDDELGRRSPTEPAGLASPEGGMGSGGASQTSPGDARRGSGAGAQGSGRTDVPGGRQVSRSSPLDARGLARAENQLRDARSSDGLMRAFLKKVAEPFGAQTVLRDMGPVETDPVYTWDQNGRVTVQVPERVISLLRKGDEAQAHAWVRRHLARTAALTNIAEAWKRSGRPTAFTTYMAEVYDGMRQQNIVGGAVSELMREAEAAGLLNGEVRAFVQKMGGLPPPNSTPRRAQWLWYLAALSQHPKAPAFIREAGARLEARRREIETSHAVARHALAAMMETMHERPVEASRNLAATLAVATKELMGTHRRRKQERRGTVKYRTRGQVADAKARWLAYSMANFYGSNVMAHPADAPLYVRARASFPVVRDNALAGRLGETMQQIFQVMEELTPALALGEREAGGATYAAEGQRQNPLPFVPAENPGAPPLPPPYAPEGQAPSILRANQPLPVGPNPHALPDYLEGRMQAMADAWARNLPRFGTAPMSAENTGPVGLVSQPKGPKLSPAAVSYSGTGPFQVQNLNWRAILKGSTLPEQLAAQAELSGHEKAALKGAAARLGNDLDAAIKRRMKVSGKTELEVHDEVNKALDDPVEMVLLQAAAPDLHTAAIRARNMLDQLSAAIASQTNSKTGDTIMQNLGRWMRRGYAAFDPQSGWSYDALVKAASLGGQIAGKDAATILKDARQFLTQRFPKATYAEIEALMRELTDRNAWAGALTRSGDSNTRLSKDVTSLMRRKKIPMELRALMGEYTNPVERFLNSASFQAQFVALHEMQKAMRIVMLNTGMASTAKNGVFTARVGGKQGQANARWSGFGDLYTTPELLAALQNAKGVMTGTDLGNKLLDAVRYVGGEAKLAKVALYPDFWSTNLFGAVAALAASGDLTLSRRSLRNITKATSTLWDSQRTQSSLLPTQKQAAIDAARDLLSRLEASGVLSAGFDMDSVLDSLNVQTRQQIEKSQVGNRVAGAAKGALIGQALGRGLAARGIGAALGAAGGLAAGNKAITAAHQKLAEWLVSKPDNWVKLASYLNNFEAYARTGMSQAAAHAKAVEIVRNTMPDYSKLPAFMREASRLGLMGSFIAFRVESIRNVWNNARYAVQELSSGNPVLMTRGAQRLMGVMLMKALSAGRLLGPLGILGAVSAASDDEDEAYRRALARPWDKYGQLVYDHLDGQEASYFNGGYLLPYSTITEIIRAGATGRDFEEGLDNVMGTLKEQFISGSVHLDPIMEAYMNQRRDGGNVSDEQGWRQLFDRTMHVLNTMEPGYAAKVERVIRGATGRDRGPAHYTVADEMLRMLGLRMNTVRHDVAIKSKLFDYQEQLRATTTLAKQAWNNWGGRRADAIGQEKQQEALARANATRAQIQQDYQAWLKDLGMLGISEGQVNSYKKQFHATFSFTPLRVVNGQVTGAK